MTMTASEQTVLLHPLHIGEIEDGAAEVGRPETGVFVSLPEQGIELIRGFLAGGTRAEVSQRFAERYGEPPDLDDFLAALADCGFIRDPAEPADLPVSGEGANVVPQMRGWALLAGLPTRRVAWLVSPPALIGWALIWLAVPAILLARPDLVPTGADARLGFGVALDALMLTALGWSLVFLHEVAHLVAVRARGCTGVLRLSNRLHVLVAETDMSAVRSIPRRQRYAPYLAGMTLTLAVFALALVARLAGADAAVFPVIAYLCLFTWLFELALFLRTDLYYVFATSLRLGNLMVDTRHWLANQAARLVGRPAPHDLSGVPPRELRIARWYSGLLLVGGGVFIGQFLLLGLPLLIGLVRDSVTRLAAGPSTGGFWDAIVLMTLTLAHFGTLGVVAVRNRIRPATAI